MVPKPSVAWRRKVAWRDKRWPVSMIDHYRLLAMIMVIVWGMIVSGLVAWVLIRGSAPHIYMLTGSEEQRDRE